MSRKKFMISLLAVVLLLSLAGSAPAKDTLKGKTIVMIIAPDQFRDEELFVPKDYFTQEGATVKVASVNRNAAKGMMGGTATPDITLNDIDTAKLDALILVGGLGSNIYWDNSRVWEMVKTVAARKKVVAAICIAPVTLARAGLLKGRKATVWESVQKEIVQQGAVYTGKPVEKDGLVITGNGPQAAREFAVTIANTLTGK